MVKTCCAYNCKYEFRKGDGTKMHSFPQCRKLRDQWIAAMNRENFVPTHAHVLCSKHFLPEDYICSRKQNFMLKKNAVPSVFPAPKSKQTEGDSNNLTLKKDFRDFITIEVIDENESGPIRRMIKRVDIQDNEEYVIKEKDDEVVTGADEEYGTEVLDTETTVAKNTNVNYQLMRNRKQPHFIGDFIFEDLFDDVQRRKYWAMSHKVIEDQKKKLRLSAAKVRELNRKLGYLTKAIADMKAKKKIVTKLVYTTEGCKTVQYHSYF